MLVKAFFPNDSDFGWYGMQRRRDGDVFELRDEEHFSESWMEFISTEKPVTRSKTKVKPRGRGRQKKVAQHEDEDERDEESEASED
jgi:hypothetical protein